MPIDRNESVNVGAMALRIALKLIRFAKGGIDKAESRELAGDLAELGLALLDSAKD